MCFARFCWPFSFYYYCFVVVGCKDINILDILKFYCKFFLHIFAVNKTKHLYNMENLLYFGLFWILTGAGNYLVFLIELKVKGLKCSKSFKRKTFKLSLAFGFIGVLLSAYFLIFPKK